MGTSSLCEWCKTPTHKRFCGQACREKWQYHTRPEWRKQKLAKNAEWQKNNPTKVAAIHRKWSRNGGADVRRAWVQAHQQEYKQMQKDWASTPEGRAARQVSWVRRRAAQANAQGWFTRAEWHALCAEHSGLCCACGTAEQTVDHVIPLSRGGSNYISNIQPLCGPCNSTKGTKIIDYR